MMLFDIYLFNFPRCRRVLNYSFSLCACCCVLFFTARRYA